MMRRDPELEPELHAFLAHKGVERHLSPEVRARALARAQSIISGGGVLRPGRLCELDTPAPIPLPRRRAVARVALAGSVALVVGFIGQVVASRGRGASPRHPLPETVAVLQPAEGPPPAREASPAVPMRPAVPRVAAARSRRAVPAAELFTLELELLQQAQAAYTRRDYETALELVANHAQLFPRGSLAEEREALRVRSLLGLGRQADAHREAVAFARRFPYSVLLPRVDDRESALE
jgi:hypothetical protein